MILLDTDHINVLKYPDHPRFASLSRRLDTSPDQDIATTVTTVEEQMRGGWPGLTVPILLRSRCRPTGSWHGYSISFRTGR